MTIRYVTYDIKDGNSYDDLYEFLELINAVEITKSTYKIDSDLKLNELSEKFKNVTNTGDKLSVIFRTTDDSLSHKVIR